jgi:uncharacterized protein (DUF1501 family)
MNESELSRRQFFRLGAGAVVVVGLGACADTSGSPGSPLKGGPTGSTPVAFSDEPSTSPRSSAPATGTPAKPGLFGGRRLVIVQLNGGNDLLNTLPPSDGKYRDLRPTLAIPEADIVALNGVADAGLHPSLAPLAKFWDAGQMAVVRGIGFDEPNRSHFVSMARWWSADDLGAPGWLGRVLDSLPSEPSPLMATALGAGAPPLLSGVRSRPTLVASPASFRFNGLQPEWLTAMGSAAGDDLIGAARRALTRSVAAVADFEHVTATAVDDGEPSAREGGATIAAGLKLAAQMLSSDVGTQIVVVSVGGFDTHYDQLIRHTELLTDLADGLVAFFDSVDKAGIADDVLVATTSEFGRRAAENGSGGCDHGAGGLSLVLGRPTTGGMHGDVDLGNLLEGDVRPSIDPRSLYTVCLDWIGADVEKVLGKRYDQLKLLKT